MPRPNILSVRDMGTMIIIPSKSRHVSIVPSDIVDDSKVVEHVHVPSKTTIIIEDVVGSDTPIINEGIFLMRVLVK